MSIIIGVIFLGIAILPLVYLTDLTRPIPYEEWETEKNGTVLEKIFLPLKRFFIDDPIDLITDAVIALKDGDYEVNEASYKKWERIRSTTHLTPVAQMVIKMIPCIGEKAARAKTMFEDYKSNFSSYLKENDSVCFRIEDKFTVRFTKDDIIIESLGYGYRAYAYDIYFSDVRKLSESVYLHPQMLKMLLANWEKMKVQIPEGIQCIDKYFNPNLTISVELGI